MKGLTATLLAVACLTTPTIASAQDVVVMRRALAVGTFTANEWRTGNWTQGAPSCSTTAVQTRTVACIRKSDGTAVSGSLCKGAAPASTMQYDDQRACVSSSTCGLPQTRNFHANGTASYTVKANVRTAAEAQTACNAYLANTTRKGVCSWDSNSNVYGIGNENGTVSFVENATVSPAASYPAFWASACTQP